MFSSKVVLTLVLLLVFAIIKTIYNSWIGTLSHLPGPWYSKHINLVLRYHTLSGRRNFYVHSLHMRYGGVVRISPTQVAVSNLTGVSQIHRMGSGFIKSSFYTSLTPDSPPGLFAMQDPAAHAKRRKLFARAFGYASSKSNWEAEVRRKVEQAVEKTRQDALNEEGGADVLKWWTIVATDIIAHLNFGESFDMLGIGKQTAYVDALGDVIIGGVLRAEMPLVYSFISYLPFAFAKRITTADETVYAYGARAITNMRSRDGTAQNLFGQMLAACDDPVEKASFADADIRHEAGNLIVAGSDTTGVTLTYLVWAVLKQPESQKMLEEEVERLSEELRLEELEASPILNSVIDETLRLYGAAPGALPRIVPKQGMSVEGWCVPGGTEVSTQAYTNHRDKKVWEDALSFNGLRFLDKSNMAAQQKTAFMPFGAGSRICIGLHLAWMELRLATALFFRHCRGAKISRCMRDEMMEFDNRFLIAPVGRCCYVTLRSSDVQSI